MSLALSSGACIDDGLALFHRTLAELCRSEVPLPRALRILEAEADNKSLARAARAMASEVEGGAKLSDAYAQHSEAFPPLYGRLVASGENAGDLAGTLEQIAGHAAHRASVTSRMRSALAYPITTAVFVVIVGIGALLFASPKLSSFAEQVSGNAAWPITLTALVALTAVIIGVAWFSARRRRSTGGGFSLPVIGPLRRTAAQASLASTLALLIRRELPLREALREAGDTAENETVRERVRAMAARAEGGEGLMESMRAGDLFEPSLLWLVETGETTGTAASALEDVAAIYRQRLARGLDRCAILIRPALELVVGVAVFFVAYSFMVPLFDYASSVFGRST